MGSVVTAAACIDDAMPLEMRCDDLLSDDEFLSLFDPIELTPSAWPFPSPAIERVASIQLRMRTIFVVPGIQKVRARPPVALTAPVKATNTTVHKSAPPVDSN